MGFFDSIADAVNSAIDAVKEFFSPTPPAPAKPCPKTAPPPPCVVQIKAKLPGTNGVRKPATDKRADNVLTASSSSVESLSGNPPVILVRGCKDVLLEAVTTPPNQAVTWTVKSNENTDPPVAITPTDGGKKATLKTNTHGSFSVIATLGACKVVWNVVFVFVRVKVNTGLIVTRNNQYLDGGSGGGNTGFASGAFVAGKYAWQGSIDVEVLGGGKSKLLGTNKVKLQILQNGIADTLTGNYAGPPAGAKAEEQAGGGLPVVDSTSNGNPFITNPVAGTIKPNNTAFKRKYWSGDSPGGGFPSVHPNAATALQTISGVNQFQTFVASVSDDAPNSIQVHAMTGWTANFKGNVSAAGIYTSNGAATTKDSDWARLSDATGGQDAGDAGVETFDPLFRSVTTKFTP